MPVTLKDIARRANVSVSTVSLILRDTAGARVSPETAERVRRIARELHYRPNLVARSLRIASTRTIGMVAPSLRGNLYSDMIAAAEEFFSQRGYDILVGFSYGDPQEEWRHVRRFAGNRVDGLLVAPTGVREAESLAFYRSLRIPLVLLDGPENAGLPGVKKNRQEGIRMALAHLFSLGRRRIALSLFAGEEFPSRERLQGYHAGSLSLGLPDVPELVVYLTDQETPGEQLAGRLLAMSPRPDAVICGNDLVAVQCIRALEAAGVAVPARIAVVGFSGLAYVAHAHVPLTTIDQSNTEIARRAAEMLWARLSSPDQPPPAETLVVPPRLVVRESCGARRV